jgi:predicted N-acyltransferase
MRGKTTETLTARVLNGMAEVAPAIWDGLANPPGRPFNPFVSHAFLEALEQSGSATARTGWKPCHLLLEDQAGQTLGAMPCYRKSHSRGEYVFDWGWADAIERVGGRYYPKLQVSVPFTPVAGPRLLVPPGALADTYRKLLAEASRSLAEQSGASSVHVTFISAPEWALFDTESWLKRTDTQFHWHNRGYGSFEEFLKDLSSRKRKNIRKERDIVARSGLRLRWLTGSDLEESHWDAFFRFYMETGSRKWGSPYLTRRFFSLIGETMRDHILLVMVERAGRPIAGALNFIGSDALFGRNWGAVEHHECLHFEACYYQAIEFAIARRLERVEAGAQGPHKLARGYLPTTTLSLHHIRDRRLARAVSDYLAAERVEVAENTALLSAHSPFRQQAIEEQDF